MGTMTDQIKCPDCGSDSYQIQSGPDGERYFSIVCLDCGCETVLSDAMRQILKKKRDA